MNNLKYFRKKNLSHPHSLVTAVMFSLKHFFLSVKFSCLMSRSSGPKVWIFCTRSLQKGSTFSLYICCSFFWIFRRNGIVASRQIVTDKSSNRWEFHVVLPEGCLVNRKSLIRAHLFTPMMAQFYYKQIPDSEVAT